MRFSCVVILAVVGLFPSAVSAFQLDGNQLLELCSGQGQICAGYVLGVADARDRDPHGIRFCIPQGVSTAQLQEVVVKHLRDSPKRTFPAAIMVSAAFAEKYHCAN